MSMNENRREFLKSTAAAAAGLGFLSLGLKAQPLMPGRSPEDIPRTHNMMIVGVKTVYLSHLPMFDGLNEKQTEFTSPHRRQVILEATFTQGTKKLTPIYSKDRLTHPKVRIYTLNPTDFVLSRVDPNDMALKTFRGNAVFRGHLEKGGQAFIGDPDNLEGSFDVNVVKVVHFRLFSPQAVKPTQLEYLLFGKGTELFLAHFITKPNDFDQIISVRVPQHPFTDAQLSDGMHVVFSARGNNALERLREKDKVPGEFQLTGATPKTLPVEVDREFYFEEGELAVPVVFPQATAEEKKSGFPD